MAQNWAYMASPMGEEWRICTDNMPAGAAQRVRDGAAIWNYERFRFAFGDNACLSDGHFPALNGVNQFDFGTGLQANVLAQTTFFFFQEAPGNIVECDTRFNSDIQWYTGTEAPEATQADWWSVAAHELGHCLGLAHEDSVTPRPVMSAALPRGVVRRALTADDRAGREAIYGAVPNASPPAPVEPTPAPSPPNNAGSDEGGGGGCQMVPGTAWQLRHLWGVLGNLGLPILTAYACRLWRRRAADQASPR